MGSIAWPIRRSPACPSPKACARQRRRRCSPSRDGSIWTGGDGALTRVRDNSATCFRGGHELPGTQVTSLFEDHAGRCGSVSTAASGCTIAADSSRLLGGTLVRSVSSPGSPRTPNSASGLRPRVRPECSCAWKASRCARRSTSRRCRGALRGIQLADCGSGPSTAIWRMCATDRQSSIGSNIPTARCSSSSCRTPTARSSPRRRTG